MVLAIRRSRVMRIGGKEESGPNLGIWERAAADGDSQFCVRAEEALGYCVGEWPHQARTNESSDESRRHLAGVSNVLGGEEGRGASVGRSRGHDDSGQTFLSAEWSGLRSPAGTSVGSANGRGGGGVSIRWSQ